MEQSRAEQSAVVKFPRHQSSWRRRRLGAGCSSPGIHGSPGSTPSSPSMRHAAGEGKKWWGVWREKMEAVAGATNAAAADMASGGRRCTWGASGASATAGRAVSSTHFVLSQRRMLAQLVAGPPGLQVSTPPPGESRAGCFMSAGRTKLTVWRPAAAAGCGRGTAQELYDERLGRHAVSRLPGCHCTASLGAPGCLARGGCSPCPPGVPLQGCGPLPPRATARGGRGYMW